LAHVDSRSRDGGIWQPRSAVVKSDDCPVQADDSSRAAIIIVGGKSVGKRD